MKTIKHFLIAILAVTIFFNCNNDDDNNPETCNNQGLYYTLGNSPQITAPEINLTTDLFPNNTIDPISNQPIPAVEIYGNDSNGDFVVFVTEVLTLNATGDADLIIGNGASETVSVTCLATDNVVGGLMRFTLSGMYNNQSISGEYCVTIDSVNP